MEADATDVANFLVTHGADVSARSNDNRTPLFMASKLGHFSIAQTLLEANAEGWRNSYLLKKTPYTFLAKSGYFRASNTSQDISSLTALDMGTPLHWAIALGQHDRQAYFFSI